MTDHKTGADRTQPGLVVGGGEVLQPVLYAPRRRGGAASVRCATRACRSAPAAAASASVSSRSTPRSRTAGLEVLATIDRAIVAGRFHPAPREGACTHCDFRPVCGPYEEERVRARTRCRELAALRGRP